MIDRRTLIVSGAAAIGAGVLAWMPADAVAPAADPRFRLTPAEWRKRLSPKVYAVLREEDTEPPFSSPLLKEHRAGTFACAGCGQPLYASKTKFESGTGWPSFWAALPGVTGTKADRSLGFMRVEEHCKSCGGHLGHIFDDGPKPTGKRHCINGLALKFVPAAGRGRT